MKEMEVPTSEKIMIPIRISDELYRRVREKEKEEKNKIRGYSINKYVAELIEKNLN